MRLDKYIETKPLNVDSSISEQCVASVATIAPSFQDSPSTSTDVLSDADKCTSSRSSQDLVTNSTSTIYPIFLAIQTILMIHCHFQEVQLIYPM